MPHLKVSGKGGKTRYLPLHPGTHGLINDYLDVAGHGFDEAARCFDRCAQQPHRPIGGRDHRGRRLSLGAALYPGQLGFLIGAHALRATAATNALDHQADIAKVQEWLGHDNIATTRAIYDHRRTRPERVDRRSRLRINDALLLAECSRDLFKQRRASALEPTSNWLSDHGSQTARDLFKLIGGLPTEPAARRQVFVPRSRVS